MNYIYLGLADLYLPAAAAAVHLQKVSGNDLPTCQELLSCPYFRAANKEDDGRLYLVGRTENGDNIYVTAVREHLEIFLRAVGSLLGVYHAMQDVIVIPCIPENPQIGHLCSVLKKIGLANTANWLGIRLIRNRFPELKQIVSKHIELG